jgi:hypothetical protein
VVKLLRTDTTLDLSQKARVVRNPNPSARRLYAPPSVHGPCLFGSAGQTPIGEWMLHSLMALSTPGHTLVLCSPASSPSRVQIRDRDFCLLMRDARRQELHSGCFSFHAGFGVGCLPRFPLILPSAPLRASLLQGQADLARWPLCRCPNLGFCFSRTPIPSSSSFILWLLFHVRVSTHFRPSFMSVGI